MTQIVKNSEKCGTGEIHYLETGQEGRKEILLLHGMKFNANTWKELGTLDLLAKSDFKAIALDMPGFGDSPPCDMASNTVLENFLRQKECNRPILIGPSMGGRISIEFCLEHPNLVGGLVLVGAVGVEENKERLSEIKVPALIVWGEKDVISPIANGHTLNEKIEGSSFVQINDAPHPCYLDQPEIWHWELTHFLETV
ncbi:MAG: alpha/beta hydrolase [Desulfobulbaceae bacterium]|uniref:Alpha/beta hydrolase n=1 Tax=Candidatus Desulfobia pelagia TaxID=2841692 RepID=A0A8J6NDN6_9BACT|nr:alpha/beta hydrolase [Candidatus Desulfobia pelagia]